MSFQGYLLKSGSTTIPLTYIKVATYAATPNRRQEKSAKRNTSGVLKRTTLAHTATTISFDTLPMNGTKQVEFMQMFKRLWSNKLQRNITLTYYDMENDSYKSGSFYMPDIEWKIKHIDGNMIYYDSTTIEFIEY